MPANERYNLMDVMKFLLAILLVCAHTASERVALPSLLDSFFSLYIIAVPFFFVASSFLFFRKIVNGSEKNKTYIKYTKRLGLMYLAWSCLYFFFVFIGWFQKGVDSSVVLDWLHKALIYTTYPTIWFLPALWIAVSLVYLLKYKFNWTTLSIIAISFIMYAFGSLEYSYHSVTPITESINDGYKSIMISWRNGFFNGFIYAAIGLLIAEKGRIRFAVSLFGSCFFGLLFIAEAFVMKKLVPASDANFLMMLVPFSYFFFCMICSFRLPDSELFVTLRKMSMLIFLSQRIFLTAIPSIILDGNISGPWDVMDNGILALLFVLVEVVLFSYVFYRLSNKFSLLKVFM